MTRGTARKVFRAAVSVAAFAAASPAAAQPVCGDHAGMVAQLIGTFGEAHRGAGLAGPRAVFEVWASDATGTWTILMVTPEGLACVVAAGNGWQGFTVPKGAPVTDAIPRGGSTPTPDARAGVPPRLVSPLAGRGGRHGFLAVFLPVPARAPRPGSLWVAARPFFAGGRA
jgi:hypothetical protein